MKLNRTKTTLKQLSIAFPVLAVTISFVAAQAAYAVKDTSPVKCLMMGTGTHKDPTMADVLREIKDRYPRVAISLSENIEDLRYENLKKFDVLLMLHMNVEKGNPPEFVKEGILQFLKDGKGLVVNHFAVANVQEWRDSIDLYGAMWVSGKSTHDPYHHFRVDVADKRHPIVKGVKSFTTDDELYFNLLARPDSHVILSAKQERFGQTVVEPILSTHQIYNARCVYFALGHDVKSTQVPEFRKIIVQSIEWAAHRR